jgi:hypothetical protein
MTSFRIAFCLSVTVCVAGALSLLPVSGSAGAEEKPAAARTATPDEIAFFEKEVLPVLKANCFKCHGDGKIRGGLRLTTREMTLKGGDTGPAVSLDKPETSPLLQAINYKDGMEMPPTGKLAQKDIDVLTKWVKAGLPYASGQAVQAKPEPAAEGGKVTAAARAYWAYRPMQRPDVPVVKNKAWVRSPVDAFLLARLEPVGIAPAPPADRVALIRRVAYDLTGLPPKPEEVDAFVKDTAPDAYERLIDRLLASPQYGEKWGRHWLDLVRYAETHGYERDLAKPAAWRYRDYVIDSFNKDKPYDLFLREQLAGDELDEVTPETLTATGYYRLGIWDDEPADRPLARYDVLDGIVSTTSQVVLGMTVGCARCHDHKKDPIPQRDYYRLLAFFQDVTDMNVRNTKNIATDAQKKEYARLVQEKEAREAELHRQEYQLEQKFALALAQKKGIRVADQPASDLVDVSFRFYRDTWKKLPDFAALKFETEGRVASDFFTLGPASRLEAIGLVFDAKLKVPHKGEYAFQFETAEGVRFTVDGKTLIDQPDRGRHAGEVKATLRDGLLPVRLEYFNSYERPHLHLSWSGPGMAERLLTEERIPEEPVKLGDLIRQHGDEVLGKAETKQLLGLSKELERSRKKKLTEPGLEVMCVEERGRAPTHVLARGNPGSPGERVEPGFPEILDEAKTKISQRDAAAPVSGKRRALAEWLTSPRNPLTARVLANRLWQFHFGRGIVPTSNDFGKLGEPPTHPELLDWLASELVDGGWQLKRMHKLLMLSSAYQMSARASEPGLRLDPANHLFGRFNMRRLSAEEVRDSILAASGRLNLKAGGPPVYPLIPKEVLAGQSRPGDGWGRSPPEEAARRSVYVHVKRSLLVPILAVHDQADTDSSCPVRFTTTVPTQSLGMLNGEFTNEEAGAFADRLRHESPDRLDAQVRRAIRLTTARPARDDEVEHDLAFIKDLQAKAKLSDREALRQYCLLALNTNEFIYLD